MSDVEREFAARACWRNPLSVVSIAFREVGSVVCSEAGRFLGDMYAACCWLGSFVGDSLMVGSFCRISDFSCRGVEWREGALSDSLDVCLMSLFV